MERRHILLRIGEKISVNEVTKCWNWTAAMTGAKNPQPVTLHWEEIDPDSPTRKLTYVRRVIYAAYYNGVPQGSRVRMKCEIPTCVNPAHMELEESAVSIQIDELGLKNKIPLNVLPVDAQRYLKKGETWD